VQTFPAEVFRLEGELFGDPDFCTFRIRGGSDFGLPSPGQTELTDLSGGIFNVDSFFDVTYQIEFAGCPGSILEGYVGTTTATIRIQTGGPVPPTPTPTATSTPTPTPVLAQCIQPDNGSGTVTLPPIGCDYLSPDDVFVIINGLPPGTTIELDGPLTDHECCPTGCPGCTLPLAPGVCETVGGSLGGDGHCFSSTLDFDITGTGTLTGFNRQIKLPVFCEVHTAPRNPGAPLQSFPGDLFRLQGSIVGDPDFDLLDITAGTDYGLPSPGQTTLTELPSGDFNVDSFFDVTYQITFVGAPGSILDGLGGTTTATIRLQTGKPMAPTPTPTPTLTTGSDGDVWKTYR
jgi:hypothetical protein